MKRRNDSHFSSITLKLPTCPTILPSHVLFHQTAFSHNVASHHTQATRHNDTSHRVRANRTPRQRVYVFALRCVARTRISSRRNTNPRWPGLDRGRLIREGNLVQNGRSFYNPLPQSWKCRARFKDFFLGWSLKDLTVCWKCDIESIKQRLKDICLSDFVILEVFKKTNNCRRGFKPEWITLRKRHRDDPIWSTR